jgi:hypothetical protein
VSVKLAAGLVEAGAPLTICVDSPVPEPSTDLPPVGV